ncbi:MAG: tetratricopeptide repeat protein [Candidatus Omnitrophica bacterium]|nr:tetratricopeptide repeat protein [Candidatus Omnitrophota bacterium]
MGLDSILKNDYPVALSYFKRALELDPSCRMALVNLGALYANTGNLKEALFIWQRASLIYPQNEEIASNIRKAKELLKH